MKPNHGKKSKVITTSKPLLKYLLFTIIFFVISPISIGWASPTCKVNLSIIHAGMGEKGRRFGKTADEVLKDYKDTDPYKAFVKGAETALLEEVKDSLCLEDAANAPISLQINFIRLNMIASKVEIDKFRRKLLRVRGSYAFVVIDHAHRFVEAAIVWNPRRMMRDQFILSGWKFNNETPLLPFLETDLNAEFEDLLHAITTPTFGDEHEKNFLNDANRELSFFHRMVAWTRDFKLRTLPEGSDSLNSHELIQKSVPALIDLTIDDLIKYSHLGYTAMTKTAIELAFTKDKRPLTKVDDIQLVDENNYYQNPWNN